MAGPNAGGTLIVHDANLLLSNTTGGATLCDEGTEPVSCPDADSELDGAGELGGDAAMFTVWAAFTPGSGSRLMGLTWGLEYDEANIVLELWDNCGLLEIPDDDWPASGSGTAVTWGSPQTDPLVKVYYLFCYTLGAAGVLSLGPHPTQGGFFGDDSVPAVLDPIAGYGQLGFDMPGFNTCPGSPLGACCDAATGECTLELPDNCPPPDIYHPEWLTCDPNPCPNAPGACCFSDGHCEFISYELCLMGGGAWLGADIPCEPQPCPPTPDERITWGKIKQKYR